MKLKFFIYDLGIQAFKQTTRVKCKTDCKMCRSMMYTYSRITSVKMY